MFISNFVKIGQLVRKFKVGDTIHTQKIETLWKYLFSLRKESRRLKVINGNLVIISYINISFWWSGVSHSVQWLAYGRMTALRCPAGAGFFLSSYPTYPDRLLDPFRLLSNGYRGLFPGVKQPGRKGNHSPSFSARFKNEWMNEWMNEPITQHPIPLHV